MITFKSKSDVITNSSTEVFIVKKKTKNDLIKKYFTDLDAINLPFLMAIRMNWSWIKNTGRHEWMAVMDILGLPYTEVSCSGEEPSQSRWDSFINKNWLVLQKKVQDLWWLDIEDHMSGYLELREWLLENNKTVWHANRH